MLATLTSPFQSFCKYRNIQKRSSWCQADPKYCCWSSHMAVWYFISDNPKNANLQTVSVSIYIVLLDHAWQPENHFSIFQYVVSLLITWIMNEHQQFLWISKCNLPVNSLITSSYTDVYLYTSWNNKDKFTPPVMCVDLVPPHSLHMHYHKP